MIKVLIADDQELIRESLGIVLGANLDMEVVGMASNGQEVLSGIKKEKPDVILMDIGLPDMSGTGSQGSCQSRYRPQSCLWWASPARRFRNHRTHQ